MKVSLEFGEENPAVYADQALILAECGALSAWRSTCSAPASPLQGLLATVSRARGDHGAAVTPTRASQKLNLLFCML